LDDIQAECRVHLVIVYGRRRPCQAYGRPAPGADQDTSAPIAVARMKFQAQIPAEETEFAGRLKNAHGPGISFFTI
jgi:hypothetical protein